MPDPSEPLGRALRPFDPADVTSSVARTELAPPGAEVSLVEWSDPGSPDGSTRLLAPVHVHWSDDETWYILDGVLNLLLDDRVVTVPAGGAATAVRGVRHTFWNPSAQPCRYLIATTPRIRALITALHDNDSGLARDARDPAAVFAAYASEFFGWELPSLAG